MSSANWWDDNDKEIIEDGESFTILGNLGKKSFAQAVPNSSVYEIDRDAKNFLRSNDEYCGIMIQCGLRVRKVEKDENGEISCSWENVGKDKDVDNHDDLSRNL